MKTAVLVVSAILAFPIPLPAGFHPPVSPDSIDVTVSLAIVQIDLTELKKVEEELGYVLDPPDGKVMFTGAERRELLEALEKAESFEYIGTETMTVNSDNASQTQKVEEVRYNSEYELEKIGSKFFRRARTRR